MRKSFWQMDLNMKEKWIKKNSLMVKEQFIIPMETFFLDFLYKDRKMESVNWKRKDNLFITEISKETR